MDDSETLTRNAVCVRNYRKRRREAGLTEVKIWIRISDLYKVRALLQPFVQDADNHLHLSLGGQYPKRS